MKRYVATAFVRGGVLKVTYACGAASDAPGVGLLAIPVDAITAVDYLSAKDRGFSDDGLHIHAGSETFVLHRRHGTADDSLSHIVGAITEEMHNARRT